jgi:hypothetical protein
LIPAAFAFGQLGLLIPLFNFLNPNGVSPAKACLLTAAACKSNALPTSWRHFDDISKPS